MRKSEKWQIAGLVFMAAAWPVMNSIDGGLVDGLWWNVLMFGLAFIALGCVLHGRMLAERGEGAYAKRK